MMLHHPTLHIEDTLDNVQSYLLATHKTWDNTLNLLSKRTNLDVDNLRKMFSNDLYLTSNQAIEMGLADGRF
jgi:ATP-dependent protease ClpP protease subunit